MLPWLEERAIQHVHAHFGTNSTEVVMLAHAMGGPPFSFTVHGPDEFDQPAQLGLAEKVSRSAFTIAITSYAKAQICRWTAYEDWPKVHVIRCGLEESFFDIPATSIPSDNNFVCVGRLSEQKGQPLLLQAVKVLVDEGKALHVTLIGAGPMQQQLQRLIEGMGLTDQVKLAGALPTKEMIRQIQGSKALVLPSFAEGLPMVIMEAMALGRPVLTTHIAGIPELVEQDKNGWLVPAGSVTALADEMRNVMNMPSETLQEMGEAAHLAVKERHSVRLQSEGLANLIEESCAVNRTRTRGNDSKLVSV